MIGLSQFLFLTVISNVVYAKSVGMNILIGFVSIIGAYLAFKFNEKFSQDKTYINIVTSDNKNDVLELCQFLRKNKIDNIITDSYTLDWNKTLKVEIISHTRYESKLVDDFISRNNIKCFREVIK
ncbi:MAG: hypothetical protein RR710_06495 [Oscillospiraceae bacterium]